MDRTQLNAAKDRLMSAAKSRWAIVRADSAALYADPKERTALIALASLAAVSAVVWGLSGHHQPQEEAPAAVAALNAPAPAEAPAPAPQSALTAPPSAQPPAPAVGPSLPAPPDAAPLARAEPAVPAEPKAAETGKPAESKQTKIAKAKEPKAAARQKPPESIEELEPVGALPPSGTALVDSQARSYESFALDIDRLTKTEFNTPKDVQAAYDQLLKHQPEKLSDGWIAYSARVVAGNETFSKAIDAEVQKRGRDAVLEKIRDPRYVNKLPGAYEALDSLMKQLARETAKLSALGNRFIQTAYAFQKKKWGEAGPRPHYAAAETARLMPAGFFTRDEPAAAPAGVTQRVLLLAASIDAGGPQASGSKELMHDPALSQCLRWARLNLNQCLAAAYFPSERAYCTGKHAINEVNACWTRLLPEKS
jgi:hypothetical protein